MLINCPKNEKILEFITIKESIPIFKKIAMCIHLMFCKVCSEKKKVFTKEWENLTEPSYDITKSLLRIFSRLQNDETLILQGWKLGKIPRKRWVPFLISPRFVLVATFLLAIAIFVIFKNGTGKVYTLKSEDHLPYIKYRFQDKNKVTVHYIEPELIQTVEFETSSVR